jgi:NADPH-dependent curcumin reductase CurA
LRNNSSITAVRKRLTLSGFIVSDHTGRQPQFFADMRAWIAEGKLRREETIVDGIERSPQAFLGLFNGRYAALFRMQARWYG